MDIAETAPTDFGAEEAQGLLTPASRAAWVCALLAVRAYREAALVARRGGAGSVLPEAVAAFEQGYLAAGWRALETSGAPASASGALRTALAAQLAPVYAALPVEAAAEALGVAGEGALATLGCVAAEGPGLVRFGAKGKSGGAVAGAGVDIVARLVGDLES